jgi:hypothetical protein
MKAGQRLPRPIETNHWLVVRDLPIIRGGHHLHKVAHTFLQTQIHIIYIHINKHRYMHTYMHTVLWDTLRVVAIASHDDDEPSIYFGRRVRTGASPCMFAGVYIICSVCMYVCMYVIMIFATL